VIGLFEVAHDIHWLWSTGRRALAVPFVERIANNGTRVR
jgi:hypothetical protein